MVELKFAPSKLAAQSDVFLERIASIATAGPTIGLDGGFLPVETPMKHGGRIHGCSHSSGIRRFPTVASKPHSGPSSARRSGNRRRDRFDWFGCQLLFEAAGAGMRHARVRSKAAPQSRRGCYLRKGNN